MKISIILKLNIWWKFTLYIYKTNWFLCILPFSKTNLQQILLVPTARTWTSWKYKYTFVIINVLCSLEQDLISTGSQPDLVDWTSNILLAWQLFLFHWNPVFSLWFGQVWLTHSQAYTWRDWSLVKKTYKCVPYQTL